jgi:hypothetical protein
MLGHAANIALAISRKEAVMIPDVFFMDAANAWENGVPNQEKTIPFHLVFDVRTLVEKITAFGIETIFVPYDANMHDPLKCSLLRVLNHANSSVVKGILKAMVPSADMNRTLDIVLSGMVTHWPTQVGHGTIDNAVCLHHRDGLDWRRQCDQWELLSPENRNCRNHEPIAQLVERRISHLPNAWIFYAGDHEIPSDLGSLNVPVIARGQTVSSDTERLTALAWTGHANISPTRDLGALLDYFLCSRMPYFIGNSVSLWSASQIVVRDTTASWYNSFGIPLAQVFKSYILPFVYTYNEGSSSTGQLLLKVSILSVRHVMPAASVHVLYHGESDASFRAWLIEHGVVVHEHNPEWQDKLEDMRLKIIAHGRKDSHLYASRGDFFGTFQRIDIPEFLSVEYCILLDADTFVVRPFTIADIGAKLPEGLAFSAEFVEKDGRARNAGVALLNVPFLRKSLDTFRAFVFNHTDGNFKRGPGDQGAFLDFYDGHVDYLSTRFNMKPYYRKKSNWDSSYIVHYHGLKPHEQIDHWFGGPCIPEKYSKCWLTQEVYKHAPYTCDAMVKFAKAATLEGTHIINSYCQLSLTRHIDLCTDLLYRMAHDDISGRPCMQYLNMTLVHKGLDPRDFPNIQE